MHDYEDEDDRPLNIIQMRQNEVFNSLRSLVELQLSAIRETVQFSDEKLEQVTKLLNESRIKIYSFKFRKFEKSKYDKAYASYEWGQDMD